MADLPLLPEEGESLDLISARFRSKKTGRYTRRVELESIVASIQATFKSILAIDNSSAELVKKAELVAGDINLLTLSLAPQKTKPVEKNKQQAVAEVKASVKSAGMNVLGLVGLIGLLKSDKLMAIVGGFFRGLLKAFGVSNKAIDNVLLAVKLAAEAFKLYLGYKVFKSVLDAFMAIKRLADATGLLSIFTRKESTKMSLQDFKWRTIAEGYKKTIDWFRSKFKMASNKIKGFVSAIKNYKRTAQVVKVFFKKIIRGFKSKVKVVYKALKNIKTWKKVIINSLRVMRKGVQVIKAAAAFTLVGFLIGAAVDAAIGTALDYFLLEEKKPGQTTGGFVLELLKKNVVSSLTFGMVDGESKTPEQKANEGNNFKAITGADSEKVIIDIASKFAPGLSKEQFVKEYDKRYLAYRSVQGPQTVKEIEARREKVWAKYSKMPEASKPKEVGSGSVPIAKPAAAPTPAMVPSSASTRTASNIPLENSTPALEPTTSATPIFNESPRQVGVASLSENVAITKKTDRQASMGSYIVNNVNNNNTVLPPAQQLKMRSSTIFSDTVGY